MASPGEMCPKCRRSRIRTRSSYQVGEDRQCRYLECSGCDYKTKSTVSSANIFRRSFVAYKQD